MPAPANLTGTAMPPTPQPTPIPRQNMLQPGALGGMAQQPPSTMQAQQRPAPAMGLMQPGALGMHGSPMMGSPQPGMQMHSDIARPAPMTGAPMQPGPAPGSVEQQALNGGGDSNKQQIQNYMQALNGVGAGSNNGFLNAPPPPQAAPPPPLVQDMTPPPSQAPPMTTIGPGRLGGPGGFLQGIGQPPPATLGGGRLGGPGGFLQGMPPAPPPGALDPNRMNLAGGQLVSDERAKQNVEPAEPSIAHFLQTIGAHNYEYKNPARDGVGTFTSPMAQELERTELGKQAVIDTPEGKKVDYARLGGVNLAAVSVVHREQEKLRAQVEQLRAAVRRVK